MQTPLALASPPPSHSVTVDGSKPFGPRTGAFAEASSTNGADPDGHDDQIKLLTQLCELNVALLQHPLHREKHKQGSEITVAPANKTQPSSDLQSADNNHDPVDLGLSELHTGSLFEMTCRLKNIVTRIQALDNATPQGPKRYDRSTALVVWSCYLRLDVLYSRALEILRRARDETGPARSGTHQLLMPELVIDGFSMGQCPDLQLSFLIHLHEQAGDRIHSCIRNAEGTSHLVRDRPELNSRGLFGPARDA